MWYFCTRMKKKRIYVLADNQDITRFGLIALLNETVMADQILEVSAMADLQKVLKQHPDAVVILDYTLFDIQSIPQLVIVKAGLPATSWLMFSDELAPTFLRQLVQTDPTISVVMKQASKKELLEALNAVAGNEVYVSEEVNEMVGQESLLSERPIALTKGESTILQQIALGKTTKEIAIEKNLSFHTVNSHRKNIFRKLQVNNVQEAIKYAIRAGLIDLSDYYI